MILNIEFYPTEQLLNAEFYTDPQTDDIDFGEIQKVTEYIGGELYSGAYEVTPNFDTQTLETAKKTLKEDITIHPITVSRTSNQSGGNTIYIGGII